METVTEECFVMKGTLAIVAVKRLHKGSPCGQGQKQFLNEVLILSRYKHPHLVDLLGYCDERDELILVYQFLEYNLNKYITMTNPSLKLSWNDRIKICIDAGSALDFLRQQVEDRFRVIHRDVKPGNNYIGQTLRAILYDLGLSTIAFINKYGSWVVTEKSGTFEYMDQTFHSSW